MGRPSKRYVICNSKIPRFVPVIESRRDGSYRCAHYGAGTAQVTTRHHDVIVLATITVLSILFGTAAGTAIRYQLI